MTTKPTEKITITFNFENEEDEKLYQEIEETLKFSETITYGPTLSKSDILKVFFKRPLETEIINYKKERITYEQKINLWVKGYQNINCKEIDKLAFIVDILPNLNKKQLNDIEKAAIKYV